jgi:imidazolonepropionase-like amidohydrolase
MHLTRRGFTAGLAGLTVAAAHRARAQPGAPAPVALQGAQYFDGQRMAGPATLLLQEGRVQALDPASLPEGTRRIDLAGQFVIPALTADHAHVGNTAGAELGRRFYTRENVAAQLARYQAFGITTVAALGMSPPLFHALRQESQEGRLPGARFLGAGTGIGMAGGAPPEGLMRLADDQVMRPRDAAETRAAVDRLADAGVDLIKIWVDGLNGAMPQMPPEMVRAASDAAHARGLRVAAHIHDLSQARIALENGVDILGHGIRDMEADAETVARMRGQGTWYIPTIQIDEAEYLYAGDPAVLEEPALRAALNPALLARFQDAEWRQGQMAKMAAKQAEVRMNQRNLAKLHDAGIRIGFGTDSGGTPVRIQGYAEHRELELMVQAGLSPASALGIATEHAAAMLRMEDIGRIQPGARADLVVLAANPLADIRNTRSIRAVWQDGVAVAGPLAG